MLLTNGYLAYIYARLCTVSDLQQWPPYYLYINHLRARIDYN